MMVALIHVARREVSLIRLTDPAGREEEALANPKLGSRQSPPQVIDGTLAVKVAAAVDLHFGNDVRNVELDRTLLDVQGRPDLLVRETAFNQFKDFAFPVGNNLPSGKGCAAIVYESDRGSHVLF
jgi:hypothetical protein